MTTWNGRHDPRVLGKVGDVGLSLLLTLALVTLLGG